MKRKALKEIKNSKIDIWYVCEKEVTVLKEVGNFIKIINQPNFGDFC